MSIIGLVKLQKIMRWISIILISALVSNTYVYASPPERTFGEWLRGRMKSSDAWDMYKNQTLAMELRPELTEREFYDLSAKERDDLAEETKRVSSSYNDYISSMSELSLRPDYSRPEFAALSIQDMRAVVEAASDTADKYFVYRNNMSRMGKDTISAAQFLALTVDERLSHYREATGTPKRFYHIGSYSALEGWKAYKTNTQALQLPLQYEEYEFIHLDIRSINNLARNAESTVNLYPKHVQLAQTIGMRPQTVSTFYDLPVREKEKWIDHAEFSIEMYDRLKTLAESADRPVPFSIRDIFNNSSKRQWRREFQRYDNKWQERVEYATNHRRMNINPDMEAFDGLTEEEQTRAAEESNLKANNWEKYSNLCSRLGSAPDRSFPASSIHQQERKIARLEDELSQRRRETVGKAIKVTAVIAAAVLAIWAGHKYNTSRDASGEQVHHYATDKSRTYTPRMKAIAEQYGLTLDNGWNKDVLPHSGRHPNQYHEFVSEGMTRAAREAGNDKDLFVRLFETYVKDTVKENPELLYQKGWEK